MCAIKWREVFRESRDQQKADIRTRQFECSSHLWKNRTVVRMDFRRDVGAVEYLGTPRTRSADHATRIGAGGVTTSRAIAYYAKKAPLRSRPIWAKWLMLVFDGSDTKRKPFLAGLGGHSLAGAGGVVATTRIVAVFSKNSPRNASTQSVWDRRFVVPLQLILSELMTAFTFGIG